MRDLGFAITAIKPLTYAVAPALAVELAITNRGATPIHSVMLACQVLIEPAARAYVEADRVRLVELFGAGAPRTLVWTHATVVVAGFDRDTRVDLVLPCPLDFSHAAAKYFDGVRDGELPIVIQLGGSVFYAGDNGNMQIAPISKSQEVRHRIPVAVWQATIRHYFPDAAPLTLQRDVLDRLHDFRREHGLATCDQAVARLLDAESLARSS